MGVRIVVDSSADMAQELKHRFTIVPLTLRFGDEEYIDGVNITSRQFYEKLVESDVLPCTSQATPYAFGEAFRDAVEAGDDVVAITVSSRLSGTYQSAEIAAADYPGRVYVVDSLNVALGSGILAEYALRLADDGMGAEEITKSLEACRDKVQLIAMVDTLEYLQRGGRISKSAAVVGGMLSIKPVISIRDGEIAVLGKARGSRNANNLLVKQIQDCGGVDFAMPVMLGYTGMSDVLLHKYIKDSAELWEGHIESLRTSIVGSVVGTHAGPGAVAVAFFRK